jgi:hypothetical protein
VNKAQRIYFLGQAVGWGNLPRRAWQILQARLGITRWKLPAGELPAGAFRAHFAAGYDAAQAPQRWRERSSRFFLPAQDGPALVAAVRKTTTAEAWDRQVVQVCRSLRAGKMVYFFNQAVQTGWPPRFNRDPIHGVDWPVDRHWSEYKQFDPGFSDIKCIWEASRFSCAFALARWYLRDGATVAAETFWELFDAWDAQNPHGLTPQSTCGQEGSFRLFAWLFAAIATLDHPAASAQRLHRMTERIWYAGRHIEGNINFARSQKNNHAISEAVGLWMIGLLFPEFKRSRRWRQIGFRVLTAELMRQIYPDGSYVQHSVNYHRVMLDDVLWGIRLGALSGDRLPESAMARVRAALSWLIEMIEPETGAVPNYGSNDGAMVLPLSTCDYTDYRPTAQAASLLLNGQRRYPPGPWDEKSVWLLGVDALDAPVVAAARGARLRFDDGGYYAFKGTNSWGLTRCHSYRDRPGQSDMLHFDLWYDHLNVLRDAGSFAYYCAAPWQHYFKSTRAHNTVEVDSEDQMIPGPRFLWLRWLRSRLIRFDTSADGRVAVFVGEHAGYARLPGRVMHRRAICRIDDSYVIIDDVLGAGEHDLALRWRLCPAAWILDGAACSAQLDGRDLTVALASSSGFDIELVSGREQPHPEGWESRYYGEKTPVPTLVAHGRSPLPVRFVTIVQPAPTLSLAGPLEARGPIRLIGVRDSVAQAAASRLSGGLLQCPP